MSGGYEVGALHTGVAATATAWREGMRPLLLGDAGKLVLVALMLPATWVLVRRYDPADRDQAGDLPRGL